MRLLRLQLEHFRNYAVADITCASDDIHVFVGPNGCGKTNLLESISTVSLGKSCRGREDAELVQWGQSFFRVIAHIRSDAGDESRVEVVRECAPRRRAAFHNDVPLSIAALVGLLPTVIFLPQEMTLFSGPPAERRRFLDQLLSQADASYVPAFSAYQRVLKQRTALLHRIADGECSAVDLDAWDRELAIKGALLTAARLHVLSVWETQLLAMLRELGEAWDGARFHYERKTCGHAADVIANELFASLVAVRDRDLALRATTVGPHREDWHMIVEDRSLPRFASRGQERVAVVALLLLAVRYLHAQRGEHPVLLFDDVFSELDDAHQRALLERLTGCQVLMTAVRMPEEANRAVLWRMREGQWSTDSVESS